MVYQLLVWNLDSVLGNTSSLVGKGAAVTQALTYKVSLQHGSLDETLSVLPFAIQRWPDANRCQVLHVLAPLTKRYYCTVL